MSDYTEDVEKHNQEITEIIGSIAEENSEYKELLRYHMTFVTLCANMFADMPNDEYFRDQFKKVMDKDLEYKHMYRNILDPYAEHPGIIDDFLGNFQVKSEILGKEEEII